MGGNDDLRSRVAVGLNDSIKGLGKREGLVPEDDEGGGTLRIQSGKPGTQRACHSLLIRMVDHHLDPGEQSLGKLMADRFGGGSENEDALVHCGSAGVFEGLG